MMVPRSMSTWAHFVPVLHAPGFCGLRLPSTVRVTVWVPAARASRAQTTRPVWNVGAYRSTTCGEPLSTCTCARPCSGPSVLTQAALPLTVNVTAGTSVALADVDERLTVPPYALGRGTFVHVPLNRAGAMPASSRGWSVNFGPLTQAPQVVPLQERTRNWYALPAAGPMARRTRVLVAEAGVSVTPVNPPSDAVVAPVAICSSDEVPVPDHVRSTGRVLFWIGDRS